MQLGVDPHSLCLHALAIRKTFATMLSVMLALAMVAANPANADPSNQLQIPTTMPTPKAVSAPQSEPDVLLVLPAGGIEQAAIDQALKDAHATVIGKIGKGPLTIFKIKTAAGKFVASEGKLRADRNFLAVQRNFIYQGQSQELTKRYPLLTDINDPYFPQEWHLGATNVPRAWPMSKGKGTILGILDTGCKTQIAELNGKCYAGWDAVGHTGYQTDLDGHGTMVATTAAAITKNAINTAAPARESYVYPVRIGLSQGQITEAAMLEGIYVAGMQGIKILNISANYPPPYSLANAQVHPALHVYLRWYSSFTGGIVFNAAGNHGRFDSSPLSPYLVVVSAMDRSYTIANFSNYGRPIWFTCPGVDIYCSHRTGGVVSADGTSFAAPQLAAIAALVWSANPGLTRGQVLNLIKDTAYRPMCQPLWTPFYGYGLPNAEAAVKAAFRR